MPSVYQTERPFSNLASGPKIGVHFSRRITVSTSAKDLVQELQKTMDELAGAPGRSSRSNGGQHHAVVTPRVETSPDRSDFTRLGETIAASLVQAA